MHRTAATAVLAALVVTTATMASAQQRPAAYARAVTGGPRTAAAPAETSVVRRPRAYLDLRYDNMVRQALDFSCGAAALATIVNDYWGKRVDESQVLDIMKKRYPGEAFKVVIRSGFSFDDLIFAAEQLGFAGQGGKVPIGELEKLAGPVIVHLNKEGFEHFVVLRKARGNMAYVADPIAGNIVMPYSDFYKQYTGSALAVWRKGANLPEGKPLMAPRRVIDSSINVGREVMRQLPPPYPMKGR